MNSTRTINGDGQQSCNFTYIENVIKANLKACHAPSSAAKALGVNIEPIYGLECVRDIRHSNMDISKAKNL